ncbi:MAG: trypsin-like peptidase domain-containing protein [Armatimonadetes bacterium]|nr:trypsin-like peptidase domain-containing protein [Armatimonadota bacterium]
MKKGSILWIGLAVGAGVFGALQVDRYLHPTPSNSSGVEVPVWNEARPTLVQNTVTPQAGVDFRQAAKKVTPSVVAIDEYQRFRRGFMSDETVEQKAQSGSGVILSSDGVIVTNNHVVSGGEVSKVKVRLSDGRSFDAKVLGKDPRSDLAVLKIDAKGLTPIVVGNRNDVEVGQWVMAVGNPLGFDNTVSVGVVSSLKRDLPVREGGLVDAIQTDAAINPGNSGGALTDLQGRLIGINSAIASGTGQSVGIGFAIPIDRVKQVVSDIIKLGYARYAGLNVNYSPQLDGVLGDAEGRAYIGQQLRMDYAKAPTRGVLIVDSRNPKIQMGDVLLRIADRNVEQSFDVIRALNARKPGEKVKIQLWSKGETKDVEVELSEIRPASVQE